MRAGATRHRAVAALAAMVIALTACTGAEPPPGPVLSLPARSEPAAVEPAVRYADARLSTMTTAEKAASVLMMHQAGTEPAALAQFVAANGLGGVILMGDNVPEDPAGVAGITATLSPEAGLPTLVGIDQEGGIVRRIRTDAGASASQLRGLPVSAAKDTFATRAAMLAGLGVSVNFGIVADVTADPSSFIFSRVLGVTAGESVARVAEAVAGEHGTVYSTLKHFPGHGVSPGDSHSSLPSTGMGLEQWRAEHAPPFAAGIEAGAEFVMFGHLVFDAVDPVPATLSATWHTLLRTELGFDGIIITDDLAMLHNSGDARYTDAASNAVAALNAGSTMLLFVGGADPATITTAITAAVDDGRLAIETLDDAAHRLLVQRRELSGETGPFIHCFEECRALVD